MFDHLSRTCRTKHAANCTGSKNNLGLVKNLEGRYDRFLGKVTALLLEALLIAVLQVMGQEPTMALCLLCFAARGQACSSSP